MYAELFIYKLQPRLVNVDVTGSQQSQPSQPDDDVSDEELASLLNPRERTTTPAAPSVVESAVVASAASGYSASAAPPSSASAPAVQISLQMRFCRACGASQTTAEFALSYNCKSLYHERCCGVRNNYTKKSLCDPCRTWIACARERQRQRDCWCCAQHSPHDDFFADAEFNDCC
eukprot:TRINITY_DN3863_c0_g1_i3.p2 TRINITY_DN3863_c0_g1~~TRINITY_DN3863_c0_g1_i3.p2  ORF type:complete len:175 (-),score=20.22 TRINITY_DN3863_c0_g1_i3:630-1154(-)